MKQEPVQQAWEQARTKEQNCFVIVEVGLLSDSERSQFMQTEVLKTPLMLQPEFEQLKNIGPWLFDLSHLSFDEFLAFMRLSQHSAVMGWIRTECLFNELAEHLSDALLARYADGSVYLLRSYMPNIVPLLHTYSDAPWHTWLFGPLQEWWVLDHSDAWQSFSGYSLQQPGEYHPIELDEALWKAIEPDPLAYSLTSELEQSAPEVFSSDCYGERLEQVRQSLEAARTEGLQSADDQTLFATLQLFDKDFPANQPDWPTVMQLVNDKASLAQALRNVPS